MNLNLSGTRKYISSPNVFSVEFGVQAGLNERQIDIVREMAMTAPLGNSRDHGFRHWLAVQSNGLAILDGMAITDFRSRSVINMFALFHDIRRQDEGVCVEHGLAGSVALNKAKTHLIDVNLTDDHACALAAFACACHTIVEIPGESIILVEHGESPVGPLTAHDLLLVQICLDADRLDIGRVGLVPNERFLSTRLAKTYSHLIPTHSFTG